MSSYIDQSRHSSYSRSSSTPTSKRNSTLESYNSFDMSSSDLSRLHHHHQHQHPHHQHQQPHHHHHHQQQQRQSMNELDSLSRAELIKEVIQLRRRIIQLELSTNKTSNKPITPTTSPKTAAAAAAASSASSSSPTTLEDNKHHHRNESRTVIAQSPTASVDSDAVEYINHSSMLTSFTEQASPFFWRALDAHQDRVHALSKRLKCIERLGTQLCEVGTQYASISNALAMEMCADWREIEPYTVVGDVLSLNANFRKLGEVLKEMQVFQDILMFSIENTFLVRLREFRSCYLRPAKENRKLLDKACEEYESVLMKTLSSPSRKTFMVRKALSSFSRSDEEERLPELRCKFQLLRFDHVSQLNEIMTVRKLELLEGICACHYAFLAFFHSGHELSLSMDPFAKNIQVLLAKKAERYTRYTRNVDIQRRQLQKSFISSNSEIESESCRVSSSSIDIDANDNNKQSNPYRSSSILKCDKSVVSKQGYLLKQSSNLKKDWKRRWFVLEDGAMYYFRPIRDSSQELEPEFVVNILICTVRAVDKYELPFTFEIISPNRRVYILQAENQSQRQQWIDVIHNCTEHMLSSQQTGVNTPSRHGKRLSLSSEKRIVDTKIDNMNMLRTLNKTCVDCDDSDPEWALINHGVSVCIECSGVHRSLGVHISKVRSLALDEWTPTLLGLMLSLGNQRFNTVFEGTLAHHKHVKKPWPNAPREKKENFIKEKYVKRSCCLKASVSMMKNCTLDLVIASSKGAIELILRALTFGASLTELVDGRNALHAAAANDHEVAVEYLLQNGAQPELKDIQGRTALDVACETKSVRASALLAPLVPQ